MRNIVQRAVRLCRLVVELHIERHACIDIKHTLGILVATLRQELIHGLQCRVVVVETHVAVAQIEERLGAVITLIEAIDVVRELGARLTHITREVDTLGSSEGQRVARRSAHIALHATTLRIGEVVVDSILLDIYIAKTAYSLKRRSRL